MKRRQRHQIAFYVSVAAHGAVVFWSLVPGLRCGPPIELPEFDFDMEEVELLDPDMIQSELVTEPPPPEPEPEPPAPKPEPEPPPPPKAEPEPGPEPKAEEPPPEPKPKKKFAARSSRASKLAPPSSTFHMLLVPKKIRRLPFKEKVLDVMAPLPDFEFLVDGGRFDALRDFDHIVIASPEIRDWTQTFLAVDYNISTEEVQRAIERAAATRNEVVEWVSDDGPLRGNPRPADPKKTDPDNRWFVFLEDNVAIYVREEFLPSVLAGPDGRKTSGNYVANLAKLRRFAARQPRAGMQVVFTGLRKRARKNPLPFQIPDEFEISVSASKRPEILIRGTFADVDQVEAFVKWWEGPFRDAINGDMRTKFTVGWVPDLLKVEIDYLDVRLVGRVTTDQAELLLGFAADGSRQTAGKTPEEIEQMRRRRVEAMEARKGGTLPPSVLDPQAEPQAPAPTTVPMPSLAPSEPKD